jgi:hypothetical protein
MNYYIDIDSFKEDIATGVDYSDIVTDGIVQSRIRFAKQRTGYGFKYFLICPNCGSRRTKLYYFNESYLCRQCYPNNIHRLTQHSAKGGYKDISNRMSRFGERHGIEFDRHPFHYYNHEVPKYKHREKWFENLAIMQALANMRFQTIFMKKRWSRETIKSVLSGTNQFLYLFELDEIDEYILDWDSGARCLLAYKG